MTTASAPKRRTVWLRRMLRWSIRLMILSCLLFYFGFYLFQEAKLFESHKTPTAYVPKPNLIPAVDDFVDCGEAKINFQMFDALTDSSKGSVFFLHGNRGNLDQCRWVIEPFLQAGYSVWTMDYRGFGRSTGRRSEAALLADAQVVYQRMRQQENEQDIIVWGRSLGSGIAAFIASGNSPKALVLETPYWSIPDAACHSRPYLFPFLFRYRLPTNEHLCHVECPVYLIHGTADERIYFQSSEKLRQWCRDKDVEVHFRPVNGGKHNLRSGPAFKAVFEEILGDISVNHRP